MGTPQGQDFADVISRLNRLDTAQVNLTVTGTANWTTVRAVGRAYQTADGIWRLKGHIEGTISPSGTTTTLTVTGVSFKILSSPEAGWGYNSNGAVAVIIAYAGSPTNIYLGGFTGTDWHIGFDCELASRPTWA